MFKFDYYEYNINQKGIIETFLNPNTIDTNINNVLLEFEDNMLKELTKLQSFKYAQGAANGAKIFENTKNNNTNISHDFFLFSNHPNYIGTDLINTQYECFKEKIVHCIFITGQWSNAWMNSKISKKNLLNITEKLVKIIGTNESIKFKTIEIFGSTEFDFEQTNKGMKKPLWKIKKI